MTDDFTALYIIAVLWSVTLVLWVASCLVCCVCWCCPTRLRRALALCTGFFFVLSILVTALLTHRLQALLRGTELAVAKTIRVARVAAALAQA